MQSIYFYCNNPFLYFSGILTAINKWEENIIILNIFNMFITFAFGIGVIGDICFIIQVIRIVNNLMIHNSKLRS